MYYRPARKRPISHDLLNSCTRSALASSHTGTSPQAAIMLLCAPIHLMRLSSGASNLGAGNRPRSKGAPRFLNLATVRTCNTCNQGDPRSEGARRTLQLGLVSSPSSPLLRAADRRDSSRAQGRQAPRRGSGRASPPTWCTYSARANK